MISSSCACPTQHVTIHLTPNHKAQSYVYSSETSNCNGRIALHYALYRSGATNIHAICNHTLALSVPWFSLAQYWRIVIYTQTTNWNCYKSGVKLAALFYKAILWYATVLIKYIPNCKVVCHSINKQKRCTSHVVKLEASSTVIACASKYRMKVQ